MTPNDPRFASQWHLAQLGNIQKIWDEYTGRGVSIGVFDDGLQYTHPDLNDNYDASLEFTYDGVTYRPTPIVLTGTDMDSHGTSVAGIIAAEGNNRIGGIGVAWGADLTGVQILTQDWIWDNPDLLSAYIRHAAQFDIMNNSWGYTPYFDEFQSLADPQSISSLIVAGYEYAAETGRGGLGTVIVQAAGNDASNANGDGINASRFIISVAAIDKAGQVKDYSNFGTNILVSAGAASVTTDLTGTGGYTALLGTAGDYTTSFGGTSAATPVVSGVVALMLEANPDLGWRDVQDILANSARLTGSIVTGNRDWETGDARSQGAGEVKGSWNDGGRIFSADYGFGKVDAFAAVRMAEVWSLMNGAPKTSATERHLSVDDNGAYQLGGYLAPSNVTLAVDDHLEVEHIEVTLTLAYDPGWGSSQSVTITLTHDYGTYFVVLAPNDNVGEEVADGFTWTFGISQARGLDAYGDWHLTIYSETSYSSIGTITDVKLDFYGADWNTNDIHHITADFLTAASADKNNLRDRVITDTNGGEDWLNMSTIASNVSASLVAGGKILVAGKQWATIGTTSQLENLVTSDGNDTLTGNASNNELYAMRGADVLYGAAGRDALHGGTGNDKLYGGTGNDRLWGDDGADVLDGGTGDDTVYGGAGDDKFSETTGAGNDVVWGGLGRDSILLGSGNDVFHDESETGKNGADSVNGGSGDDALWGDGGNDTLLGDAGNDTLSGGVGNDSLIGGLGNDSLLGGDGIDVLSGDGGDDVLSGGLGNDRLLAGAGNDRVQGDDGNDSLVGDIGNDTLSGGLGNDSLFAGSGNDILNGDAGNDSLLGDAGNDVLSGGVGNDTLLGGAGRDSLHGGAGNDLLTGGSDADSFIFAAGDGADRVSDFVDNVDTLVLNSDLWDGLTMTVAEVITSFARLTKGGVIFDFGAGDTVTLTGPKTIAALQDDVLIL